MARIVAAVVLSLLALPVCGPAQQLPPTDLPVESAPGPTAAELPGPLPEAGLPQAQVDGNLPVVEAAPSPWGWAQPPLEYTRAGRYWPTLWGLAALPVYLGGNRMAPNGVPYNPLFSMDLDLNIGLYNVKTVYLFFTSDFWGQKAMSGVTNDKQGQFDFSKREYDLTAGIACNYWNKWEARVYAYSLNNLNRGVYLDQPFGYKDGIGLENRYYFGDLFFDVARRRSVALGYLPTRELVGGDGLGFRPSLYAQMQLVYDLIGEKLFVSMDSQFICRRPLEGKLLWVDAGVSTRPFTRLPGLEFRAGAQETYDLQVDISRQLWYLALRFVF